MSLGIAVFLAVYLYVGYVAGRTVWYEHHDVALVFGTPFHLGYGLPFSGDACYLDALQQWQRFLLSSHSLISCYRGILSAKLL